MPVSQEPKPQSSTSSVSLGILIYQGIYYLGCCLIVKGKDRNTNPIVNQCTKITTIFSQLFPYPLRESMSVALCDRMEKISAFSTGWFLISLWSSFPMSLTWIAMCGIAPGPMPGVGLSQSVCKGKQSYGSRAISTSEHRQRDSEFFLSVRFARFFKWWPQKPLTTVFLSRSHSALHSKCSSTWNPEVTDCSLPSLD